MAAVPFRTPDSMEGNLPEPGSGFQPNIRDDIPANELGHPTAIEPQTLDSWDRGRATSWTADDATNVFTQLAWQYPNLTIPALTSASQQILKLSDQFPEIFDVLAEDTRVGLAMTDENIAQRIADGMDRTQMAPLIDAVVQEWMVQGASDVFQVLNREQSTVLTEKFNRVSSAQAEDVQRRVLAAHGFGDIGGRLSWEAERPTVAAAGVYAAGVTGSDGEWASDGSSLAFKISPVDGAPIQVLLSLDEGTRVESTNDAQFELVRALMGDAHEIKNRQNLPDDPVEFRKLFSKDTYDFIANVEKSKVGRSILNGLWTNLQLLFNPTKLVTGVENLDTLEAKQDRSIQQLVDEQIATGEVNQTMAIVAIADEIDRQQQEAGIVQMGPGEVIEAATSWFFDNKETIDEQYRQSIDSDEFVSGLKDVLSEDPISKQFIDAGMGKVMQAVQWWESIVQWIGVHNIALVEGAFQFVAGGGEDGFDRVKDVIDRANDSETVGDYFGFEGELKANVNTGASFIFDPTNLFFVGAGKGVKFGMEMLSNPAMASQIIRSRGVRTMIDQIVLKTGDDAVRTVLAISSGLDSASIRRLVDIGEMSVGNNAAPIREEIEQILMKNLPSGEGTWMAEVVGRAASRSTVEGFSHLLNKWPGLDDSTKQKIIHVFGNVDTGRAAGLAENTWVDNMLEWAVQLDGLGSMSLPERVRAITKAFDDQAGASGMVVPAEAKVTLRTHEVQTRGQLAEIRRDAKSRVFTTESGGVYRVDDLPVVQEAVTNLQRGIDDLQANPFPKADATRSEQLEFIKLDNPELYDHYEQAVLNAADDAEVKALWDELLDIVNTPDDMLLGIRHQVPEEVLLQLDELKVVSAHLEQLNDELLGVAKQGHSRVAAAQRAQVGLEIPQSRDVFIRFMYDWFDDIADDLGLEVLERGGKTVMNPFTGKPQYKWEPVTGRSGKHLPETSDEAAAWFGFAQGDTQSGEALKALGFANRVGTVPLPASPMEILGYKHAGPEVWQTIRSSKAGNAAAAVSRGLKTVFAYNLLLNPVTAFKAHFDEVLRFMVDTGKVGTGARVAVGAEGPVSSWADQYGRNLRNFVSRQQQVWEIVEAPTSRRGSAWYLDQVERFLGGTVTRDDGFRAFAKSQLDDNPQWFYDWWETEGKRATRSGKVRTTEGGLTIDAADLTGTEAYRVMENATNLFFENGVDETARAALRQRMFEAATGGNKLSRSGDGELLRKVLKVPGETNPNTGWGPMMFEVLFGRPAERRGAVFFDHYFDTAKQTMMAGKGAGTEKSRILTAEFLMKEAGVSKKDAQFLLQQGRRNPYVRQILDEHGWTTEAAIEAAAARYAGRMADNLMYRLSATSMAGKTAEAGLAIPFLRAQTDFLGWWWKQLTKPSTMRISPERRQAFSALGAIAEGVEQVPLNARVLSRYAHLLGAMNDDEETTIEKAIASLTFLPLRASNEVMMDILPHPGPVPGFIFDHYLPDDNKVREFAEGIFPGLTFTPGDPSLSDIGDYVIPPNSRSWRGIGSSISRLFGAGGEQPDGWLGALWSSFFQQERLPYAYSDFMAEAAGDWLSENLMTYSPGGTQWETELDGLHEKVAAEANSAEGWNRLRRVGIPWSDGVSTSESLKNFRGIVEEAQLLQSLGVLTEEDMTDLLGDGESKGTWQKWLDEEATPEEIRFLRDKFAAVVFERSDVEVAPGMTVRDYMLALHPEMAANMVSKGQCAVNPDGSFVKGEYCRADGRIQIADDAQAAEIRAEGFRNGWFEQRGALGADGWVYEAQENALNARWKVIKAMWKGVTGREYGVLPKSLQNSRINLPASAQTLLEQVGVTDIQNGMRAEDFYDQIKAWEDTHHDYAPGGGSMIWENPFVESVKKQPGGIVLIDQMEQANRDAAKVGIDYVGDWPEEYKQIVRDEMSKLILQGAGKPGTPTVQDYAKWWERYFGPLDWETPNPPPLGSEEIERRVTVSPSEFRDGTAEVIDGDGVSLLTKDGPVEIRIIGINAPERGTEGSMVATQNLREFLLEASNVEFVVWRPEDFGVSQAVTPDGRERLLLWMYVDGVPVFDKSLFTSDNRRGAGIGGTPVDLWGILEANRSG